MIILKKLFQKLLFSALVSFGRLRTSARGALLSARPELVEGYELRCQKKINKKSILIFLSTLVLVHNFLDAAPVVTKKATEVFKKWLEWQRLYEPVNIAQQQDVLVQQFFKNYRSCYEQNLLILRAHFLPLLQTLTDNQINEHGHHIKETDNKTITETLKKLYASIDGDMPTFIQTLQDLSCGDTKQEPTKTNASISMDLINANVAACSLLFGQADAQKDNALQFEIANKFTQFCFQDDTFPLFQKMLLQKKSHPVAQFMYSTMWKRFVNTGWHDWSTQSLKNIKQAADAGKKIVYIAGGSDLYQLITHGIYNIKIIDPQLPSQPNYYANEWEWIMKGAGADGGLGDKITFDAEGIVMTRISYQEDNNPFKARLENGQVIAINPSKTVWLLTDRQGKQLGTYTLERRFVEQADFQVTNDQALLMSFNELSFVCRPDFLNGWRIEQSKFTDDITVFIKQLHKPVGKAEMCNMRTASLLNNSDLKCIELGICIN